MGDENENETKILVYVHKLNAYGEPRAYSTLARAESAARRALRRDFGREKIRCIRIWNGPGDNADTRWIEIRRAGELWNRSSADGVTLFDVWA